MPAPDRPPATAIIVGAGRGTRFGAADKVLAPLGGRPVIAHALDAAEAAELVTTIVVVAGEHLLDTVAELTASGAWPKVVATVPGGRRRQDSVAAGLAAVPPGTPLVAVHDAARPLASPALFDACLIAADRCGAAIAALPVADTLKRVEEGRILQTVSREGLWAAQTPQAFRLDLLRRAFALAVERGLEVTDEASLLEALGTVVTVVPGSLANLKITRPEDLEIAEALLASRRSAHGVMG
ncbi:MAG: 2-C-methyl-D-erythritol 4-phosphate cytidylyltransferase [Thermomicrobiales bacterium]|nr:2-C-methyl-D-erythritol 4-phosphate cytidylyltransferase [Thermomicrobiales bacterium]